MKTAKPFGTIGESRGDEIASRDEGSFFLAVQTAGAAQGTLLFIGTGVLADSLAKVLSTQGLKVQRAAIDQALASARAHAPFMVLLAGDAARDRGLSIRTRLEQLDRDRPLPVLVILAPEQSGMPGQPVPRHVGNMAPTGGVNECARRVQAVIELLLDEGLESCSLQQLADTVTSRSKGAEPSASKSSSSDKLPKVTTSASAAKRGSAPAGKTAAAKSAEPVSAQPRKGAAATNITPAAGAPQPTAAGQEVPARDAQKSAASRTAKAASDASSSLHAAAAATTSKDRQPHPENSAAATSGSAPTALKVTHTAAASAVIAAVVGDEPKPERAAALKPGTAELKASAASAPKGPPSLASKVPAAASSKAAASAFSAAPAAAAVQALDANVARPDAAASGKIALAIGAQPVHADNAPVTFEQADTSARLKRPAPDATPSGRQDVQTAHPPASDAGAAAAKPKSDRPTKRPKRNRSSRAPGAKPPSRGATIDLDGSAALTEAPAGTSPEHEAVTVAPPSEQLAITAPPPLPAAKSKQPEAQERARVAVESRTRTRLGMPQDSSALAALTQAETAALVAERNNRLASISCDDFPTENSGRKSKDRSSDSLVPERILSEHPAPAADAPRRAKTGEHAAPPALPSARAARRAKTGDHAAASSLPAERDHAPRRPTTGEQPVAADSGDTRRRPTTGERLASESLPADRRPMTGERATSPAPAADSGNAARRPKTGEHAAADSSNAAHRPKSGEHTAAQSFAVAPSPARDQAPQRAKTGSHVAASLPPQRDPFATPSFSAPGRDPFGTQKLVNASSVEGAPRRPTTREILASPSMPVPSAEPRKPTARDLLASPSFSANDNAVEARRPNTREILASASMPANDNAPRKPTGRDILAAPSGSVNDNAAGTRKALVRTPLDTPSAQLPNLPPSTPEASQSRKRRWPMWAGLVAVSCAGVTFYVLNMQPAANDNHAALGSLEQVPALAPTPVAVSPSAPAEMPAASTRTSRAAEQSGAAAAGSSSAAASRAGKLERGPEPESDAGRARALMEEGAMLQSQGRLGLAESAYQKALAIMPDHPSAMAALVRVHLARRDGAEALRWAQRLAAKNPKDGVSQLLLGDALALRGDSEGARDAWTAAAERGNAMARQRLAE